MILSEYLSSLDKNSIVAIGCNEGSGFCYIGPAGNLSLITASFDKNLVNRLIRKEEKEEKLNHYMAEIDSDSKSAIRSIERQMKKLEKKISDYIPPLEREVVNHYMKTIDDCEAVIITGYEDCGYWFKKEFDKSVKKNGLTYLALYGG